MTSFVLLMLLICGLPSSTSFRSPCFLQRQTKQSSIFALWESKGQITDTGYTQDEVFNYLQGKSNSKWKGNRKILERKNQIPNPSLSPNQVVQIVTQALQINDDPQLDHGCQVLLEFGNPLGSIRLSGLDAAEYGRFLRSTEYEILLESSAVRLIGDAKLVDNGLKAVQKVEVSYGGGNEEGGRTVYLDFFLSKIEKCWLIDAILTSST